MGSCRRVCGDALSFLGTGLIGEKAPDRFGCSSTVIRPMINKVTNREAVLVLAGGVARMVAVVVP